MFAKKATKNYEIFIVNFTLTMLSKCQIDGEDFVIFCGLLRKHELQPNFKKKPERVDVFLYLSHKKIKGRVESVLENHLRVTF